LNGGAGSETTFAVNASDASCLEETFESLELLTDDFIAVGVNAVHIDALESRQDTVVSARSSDVGNFGGVQQRLSGDASSVEARATDLVFFDERDAHTEFHATNSCGVTTTTATENDEIERHFSHYWHSSHRKQEKSSASKTLLPALCRRANGYARDAR
jgi:hypothetical protein